MRTFTKEDGAKYKVDMENDGWIFSSLYGKDSNCYKGVKEGFNCFIYLKEKACDDFDSIISRIVIWDSNDLCVEPPYPDYNWEIIKKNRLKCDFCGEYVDKVIQIAFANKSCKKCESKARKEMEITGWND